MTSFFYEISSSFNLSLGEYVMDPIERFGNDFDCPMKKIKKVKQVSSVNEYQAIFLREVCTS
ncbi:hypothetical protein HAX54_039642, partial [Datura stramonium]|nr:hypothetical protein [Datura stramonium]